MSAIRFRATDRPAATQALLALIQYARSRGGESSFLPSNVTAILKTGLVVEGPDSELEAVRRVLAEVEGLVEVDR